MRTIYLDSDFKVHLKQFDGCISYETDYFDGKCNIYIEGYRCVPKDSIWIRDDGIEFYGPMIAPVSSFIQTFTAQAQYEEDCENMMPLNDVAELIDALYEADMEMIG